MATDHPLATLAIFSGEKGRAMGRGWSMATRTLEPSSAETGQPIGVPKTCGIMWPIGDSNMIFEWKTTGFWDVYPIFRQIHVCFYSHPRLGRWSLMIFMLCTCLNHIPVCLMKRLLGWDVRWETAEYYQMLPDVHGHAWLLLHLGGCVLEKCTGVSFNMKPFTNATIC